MFAIVDIAGQQVKVSENTKYYVPKLEAELESEVTFDKVLLFQGAENTEFGAPYLSGHKIVAKVLDHVKDDKVTVFKKKRRISYKRLRGHRQQLTQIEVTQLI